ncbi:glycosyltransferase [Octadecabacter sp. CECT 8868]|uniref:glycosyltransferase n=1 Tax=Octadecabacter algicola TaxID=2909342 RepID=UPI001F3A9CB5|nr:glycosyltransferase [Octadecabacter algicola]MCF2903360.1 glycosyltransferase [Octadecabacter algicola]
MFVRRIYSVFERYADIHVAIDVPVDRAQPNGSGADVTIKSVSIAANRLCFTAVGPFESVELSLNKASVPVLGVRQTDGSYNYEGSLPFELGEATLRFGVGNEEADVSLPSISPARLARARVWQGCRFCAQIVRSLPQIYRWKVKGDLRERELVKERFGLRIRPPAMALEPGLFDKAKAAVGPPRQATLMMPVFNAYDLLPNALDRIERYSGQGWRLVLVEDCSTDPHVRPFLEEWCADARRADRVTLVKHSENKGFVGAANTGLKQAQTWPDDPVVLVNSDAFVPDGWLDRLLAHLDSPDVASVTPMSNDAEIFTVPVLCAPSALTSGAVDELDAVAATFDPIKAQIDVPTGVGFCMAMSPKYLRDVPFFDTAFGRGYGEENDWCKKTEALGGRHVAAGNVFVEHYGGMSFGSAAKQRLLEKNIAKLAARYPKYEKEVHTFISNDPLATVRLALALKWASVHQEDPVPIFLAHAAGGGADIYLDERIADCIAVGGAAVVVRVGLRMSWQIELHSGQGLTIGMCDDVETLLSMIGGLAERRVIYSCGVGDPDPIRLPDVLLRMADSGQHPVEVLMHDYFPISPSFTLVGSDGTYQGVPRAGGPLEDDPAHQPNGKGLADWQSEWGRLLRAAQDVQVFSNVSKNLLTEAYPEIANKVSVVPHGLHSQPGAIEPAKYGQGGLVIGVLGNIGEHKGADVVVELSKELDRTGAGRIVVIGNLAPGFHLAHGSKVHGTYDVCDLPALVSRYGISNWFIPSIWPETFSFTTHEALATGMPVFAFDLGAQGAAVEAAVKTGARGGVLPLPRIGRLDQTSAAELLSFLTASETGEPHD